MKAYLQMILFAIFIIGINGVDVCNKDIPNPDEDVCRMYPTAENYTHCCYFESDSQDHTGCIQINDDQYENIKRYKSFYKQHYGLSSLKIKCSGGFLAYSFFVLLALLL